MCGFSHILILKEPCILLHKNINFNQNEIKNGKFHTQFYRDEPCASVHIRITD